MRDSEPDGATPIDPDEATDLLHKHIQTREELNLWEQENILLAAQWARRTPINPLADAFIRGLHRRMFDNTWAWAGQYRRTNKNIGVDWATIPLEIHKLVLDGDLWIANQTYAVDEAALRLHHRLVYIHPFPNGNGRHARLWCDTLLAQNGRPPLVWKSTELNGPGDARAAYIRALQSADGNDYKPLFDLYLLQRTE